MPEPNDNCIVQFLNYPDLAERPSKSMDELNLSNEARSRLKLLVSSLNYTQSCIWPILYNHLDLVVTSVIQDRLNSYFIPPYTNVNLERQSLDLLVLSKNSEEAVKRFKAAMPFKLQNIPIYSLFPNETLIDAANKFRSVKVLFASTLKIDELREANLLDKRPVTSVIVDGIESQNVNSMQDLKGSLTKLFEVLQPKQRILINRSYSPNIKTFAKRLAPKAVDVKMSMILKSSNLKHYLSFVSENNKTYRLESILSTSLNHSIERSIVYTNSDLLSSSLYNSLQYKGNFDCVLLTECSEPNEISQVLDKIENGSALTVISTFSASRFLNPSKFSQIFNYSCAESLDDYREKCVSKEGWRTKKIYNLYTNADAKYAGVLMQICEEANLIVPKELRELLKGRDIEERDEEDMEDIMTFERPKFEEFIEED